MDVQIEPSWKTVLQPEFSKPYFLQIVHFLKTEKNAGKTIYPPGPLIFNAFNQTPFDRVKVVLLGQDPYHGAGQAHGLSFSVPDGVRPPPSLVNIFKELHSDLELPVPAGGNLTHWADQGVLLLNAYLTVDSVIRTCSEKKEHLVFLLWGKFAQEKQPLIDETRHLVLKAAHPSPYSANNGFFGCRHFSKTNEYLKAESITPIDWKL